MLETSHALYHLLLHARELAGARCASFFRAQDQAQEVVLQATSFSPAPPNPSRFRYGEGLVGTAAADGQRTLCSDTGRDSRFQNRPQEGPSQRVVCLPIHAPETVGVLNLSWESQSDFPADEVLDHLTDSFQSYFRPRSRPPRRDQRSPEEMLGAGAGLIRSTLPSPDSGGAGVEVFSFHRPYQGVGGDHLFSLRSKDRVFFGLLDGSGHDLASGLVTSLALGSLRTSLQQGVPPPQALGAADACLRGAVPPGWFVTGMLCALDRAQARLSFYGAGHPAGLILDRDLGQVYYAASTSTALGFGCMDETPPKNRRIPARTRILLVSDGLQDMAPEPDRDPCQVLAETLVATKDLSPAQLAQHLEAWLKNSAEVLDDVSFLIVDIDRDKLGVELSDPRD